MYDPSEYFRQTGAFMADLVEKPPKNLSRSCHRSGLRNTEFLPRSTTRQPGPFSWDATPYWREVIDCVDPEDPTRFIAVQKGAQVAATVGLLENVIGYYIEHVKGSPICFLRQIKNSQTCE